MQLELAAAYVGLSVGAVPTERKNGRFPKLVCLKAGRIVWLRDDLDRWLDEKAGRVIGRRVGVAGLISDAAADTAPHRPEGGETSHAQGFVAAPRGTSRGGLSGWDRGWLLMSMATVWIDDEGRLAISSRMKSRRTKPSTDRFMTDTERQLAAHQARMLDMLVARDFTTMPVEQQTLRQLTDALREQRRKTSTVGSPTTRTEEETKGNE